MGKFKFTETGIAGLIVIEPTVFGDERGYFMETWRADEFAEAGLPVHFVQDNQSKSRKGVLRGLHFQKKNPQGKLMRVISGEVYDVAVDLRKSSATFGKWYGVPLSAENKKQFYVPEGFAHGFLVLSEAAEFVYKCTRFYDPNDEGGLAWDDPSVGIKWPMVQLDILLSEKDQVLPKLASLAENGECILF
jgi:dTDP-4-dehydrorhamnose 3,5-epimerase